MQKFILWLLLFFVGLAETGLAQERYTDRIYDNNLMTALLHPSGNELAPPFIDLKTAQALELHFDDLRGQIRDYQYTVVHCNSDWTPSALLNTEYLEGFFEDYITTYSFSFNTRTPYVHYSLLVPNQNMKLKKSGNYILKVYEPGKSEQPALTLRFVVFERLAGVNARVKRSDLVQLRDKVQEVDVTVQTPFAISNAFSEVKVSILQNFRWDNAVQNLPPVFVRENELVFDYDKKSSFPAGNEYRYFDMQSLRLQSERVGRISLGENRVLVDAVPDRVRARLPYSSYEDLDGRFLIKSTDGPNNPLTDADYAEVTFSLPYQEPLATGTLYLHGFFRLNAADPFAQLKYNYDTRAYEVKMLLKQGYYDYQYVLVNDRGEADATLIEGSFFETRNTYTVIVYYRDFSSDYDRVIGLLTVEGSGGY